MLSNNDLAVLRTKLANQRTYLAFLRTGIIISGIAGLFKSFYVVIFGIFMVIVSAVQYILINNNIINQEKLLNNIYLDYIPLVYILLAFLTFYLQIYEKSNNEEDSKAIMNLD